MTAINVYSKEQTDAKLAETQPKLTAGANITISEDNVISSTGGGGGGSYVAGEGISISGQVISNAAIPDVDKAYVDAQLATKPDTADVYTKTQADTLLALKADKSTTYTKSEVDTALALKADQATTYTKTEVDNLLPDADELVPDYSGASAGDVLTIESGAPVWKAAGGVEVLRATFTGISAVKDFAAWVLTNATSDDVISLKWTNVYGGNTQWLTGSALSLSEQSTGTNITLDGLCFYLSTIAGANKAVFARISTVTSDDDKTFYGYYLQVTTAASMISSSGTRLENIDNVVVKATITKHTYTRR